MKSVSHYYTVQFIADYFVMTVNVEAPDEDTAEATATQLIVDYYGFDVGKLSHEVLAWSNGDAL